jgi:O-acetyl-ADP-ribose deacetylase (regulator of RNase III)
VNDICKSLELEDYRSLIHLDEEFLQPSPASDKAEERLKIIEDLLNYLYSESSDDFFDEISNYERKRNILYSLLTVRPPNQLPSWFHEKLGSLLQRESLGKTEYSSNLHRISEAFPNSKFKAAEICSIWKGDITTLECDAIVNAANKYLLGCFRPFHRCIDNAIHSAAGPMLREDCNTIINLQGCVEGTGCAKITRAYNLQSKFVLHTVGPIYNKSNGIVQQKNKQELADSYTSCLNLAKQIPSIRKVAFCSISTGEFGFPMEAATKIALDTVEEWVIKNPERFDLIIFDVFSEKDYNIYKNLIIRE